MLGLLSVIKQSHEMLVSFTHQYMHIIIRTADYFKECECVELNVLWLI